MKQFHELFQLSYIVLHKTLTSYNDLDTSFYESNQFLTF